MRRALLFCVTMVGLLAAAPSAQAGTSGLDITQVDGERPPAAGANVWAPAGATITIRGTFSGNGSQAVPPTGPLFAYLERDGRPDLLLAPVRVRPLDGFLLRASATFAIPEIPRAVYRVAVCEFGCDRGPGDLAPTTLTVAGTAPEARLVLALHRLTIRMPHLRDEARGSREVRHQLDEAIAARDAARTSLEMMRAANQRLTSQRDVALDGREVAEADVRATELEARNWRYAAYLLALITAVTWIVAAVRRRDTVRIRIPDTIEELDAADDRADR